MAFSDSIEYKTLKDNIKELKLAIGPQLTPLAARLVATRLLSDITFTTICTSDVSESDGAALVLESVEHKVQLNPHSYHTFVAVLLGDDIRYDRILQKLIDTYRLYVQQSRIPQSAGTVTKVMECLQQQLTVDNLTEVVDCIHDLSRHTLIQLGSTLGLSYVRLQRLTNPRDIAQSWLQGDDHVLMTSGEPSWISLVIALQRIGHPDVASCIIKKHEKADHPLQQHMETESAVTSIPNGERYEHDQLAELYIKLCDYSLHWREIGKILGFRNGELYVIQSNPSLFTQGPSSFLREMLSQWLHWALGDRHGSHGYATKEALRNALRQAGLNAVAEDLPPGETPCHWSEARMKAAKPKMRYS